MKGQLARVAALLGWADRSIALIDRCRPSNAASEARRTSELLLRKQPANPVWVYAPPPDFGPLRAELTRVASTLEPGDELAALYAARADELELEARIAEAIGGSRFSELARRRYPVPPGHVARARARAWAGPDGEPAVSEPELIR